MHHSDDHPFHATWIDIPLGIRALVAAACWRGRILHATSNIVSARSGLPDHTPQAGAHLTQCTAPAD